MIGEREREGDLRRIPRGQLGSSFSSSGKLTCTQTTTMNPIANSSVTGACPVAQTNRKKRNKTGQVRANRERATIR